MKDGQFIYSPHITTVYIKLHHLNPLLTSTFFACLSLVIISNYVFEMRINDLNTWNSFILQL